MLLNSNAPTSTRLPVTMGVPPVDPMDDPHSPLYAVKTWVSMTNLWALYIRLTDPGDSQRCLYAEELRVARLHLARALAEL